MALDDNHIVLFDGHPRVLDLTTGAIVEQWSDLDGGEGLHQPSVNLKPPTPPWLATDPARGRFALGWPDRIVVMALRSADHSALQRELLASQEDIEAGRLIDAEEVLKDLRNE